MSNQEEIELNPRGTASAYAIVESFNNRFREQCRSSYWLHSIEHANEKIGGLDMGLSFRGVVTCL